ncbi:DnaJ domain-containing protein [Candidatus Vidania fulgoroideorum]
MKDYYKILQIDKSASSSEIKNSYKRLAMKYHPDRNQGDKNSELKFKEINEAYSVLGDESKKYEYDNGKESFFEEDENFNEGFDFFKDIFDFGDKEEDFNFRLEITLEESQMGGRKFVKVPISRECPSCEGSTREKGTSLKRCNICDGNGFIRSKKNFMNIQFTCENCKGEGFYNPSICKVCHGEGHLLQEEEVCVKLSAPIFEGEEIFVKTKGGQKVNFIVRLKEHSFFKREGLNLFCDIKIFFVDMIVGKEFDLKLLNKTLKIKIPRCSNPDKNFVLKRLGLKSKTKTGDIFVKFIPTFPKVISNKQINILKKFSKY